MKIPNIKPFSSQWFQWLARFLLLSSSVAAFILSFYHSLHGFQYVYSDFMYSRVGTNAALAFALPLLVLALVAWFRPRAGGITATLWILTILVIFLVRLINEYFDGYNNSMFWPIGIVYLIGAIMHLFLPRDKENSLPADARFRWAAIIATFAAPAAFIILSIWIYIFKNIPAGTGIGLLFFSPLAIILGIIAVAWPFYGGIGIIIVGSLFFSLTLVTDHYPMYYVPISSVFIIGGTLHLMRERLFGWPHLSMPRLSPRI